MANGTRDKKGQKMWDRTRKSKEKKWKLRKSRHQKVKTATGKRCARRAGRHNPADGAENVDLTEEKDEETNPIVWKGAISMPDEGIFSVAARQVGGTAVGTDSQAWSFFFPSTHSIIEGRLPSPTAASYLEQSRTALRTELVVMKLDPFLETDVLTTAAAAHQLQVPSNGEENKTAFERMIAYFHRRDRYGVLPCDASVRGRIIKDFYIAALPKHAPIPTWLDLMNLDEFAGPKSHSRTKDIFLLVAVLFKGTLPSPKASEQPSLSSARCKISSGHQRKWRDDDTGSTAEHRCTVRDAQASARNYADEQPRLGRSAAGELEPGKSPNPAGSPSTPPGPPPGPPLDLHHRGHWVLWTCLCMVSDLLSHSSTEQAAREAQEVPEAPMVGNSRRPNNHRKLLSISMAAKQRNGRKTLTTLQGLPKEYDQKKILKAFKKEFACNGTIVEDEELGHVIQLQGDQRQKISAFLCVALFLQLVGSSVADSRSSDPTGLRRASTRPTSKSTVSKPTISSFKDL
ncbi:hypothetical protein L7F22_068393 [Adiantum nelumboides]|nr:hypothetical protein [Adiantum nelumboides]